MRNGTNRANHDFAVTPSANIQRSQFDLSHGHKTAFDSGYLVPFFNTLAYPGDTFNVNANCFARFSSAMIVAPMDNAYVDVFFLACPIRLIWANFKKFMGEQTNPGDSISYTIPQTQWPASGFAVGSLYDYLGVPTVGQITGGVQKYVNNLYPRAYNLCYNEWFRDENMINSVTVDTGDGPDTYTNYVLLKRGKRKDYLTSCLPWPQKFTAQALPLGGQANVLRNSNAGAWEIYNSSTNTLNTSGNTLLARAGVGTLEESSLTNTLSLDPNGGLYADLTTATGATINAFRQAIQIQAMYERDARSGTRYTEIIQGHFNVVSPDARLQRPEYLGGGSFPIKINPTVQTSVTAATPQGNIASFGAISTPRSGFVKSFTEHTIVLGIVSVRCDLSYQQGLSRDWTDQTRNDMYWPLLANLGEQAVLQQEIYCLGDSTNDGTVFGYQERYGHLRYMNSKITGIMRSTAATPIDVWHFAQKFTSAPTLNSTFINEAPPIARALAVTSEPQIIFDSWIDFKAARPMPTYSVPALLGRF